MLNPLKEMIAMNKHKFGFQLYKKWFLYNIPLVVLSIILFTYSVYLAKISFIYPSFIFFLSTIGWGVTAFAGMRDNKNQSN